MYSIDDHFAKKSGAKSSSEIKLVQLEYIYMINSLIFTVLPASLYYQVFIYPTECKLRLF